MRKPLPMEEQKKSVIWQEWERGTPMSKIARVIEKPPATVFSYLQYYDGIQPRRRHNGPEYLSGTLVAWDSKHQITLSYIQPEKPQKTHMPSATTGLFVTNGWELKSFTQSKRCKMGSSPAEGGIVS